MLGEEPFVTVYPHLHIRDFFGRSANGFALTVEIRFDIDFNLGFVRERINEIVIGSPAGQLVFIGRRTADEEFFDTVIGFEGYF